MNKDLLLITITGPSGAGKDTAARIISQCLGWPIICSYTTRPMREVEVNGREHWFVDRCNVPHEDMLAYTIYGGHEYWTTIKQVREAGHCAIYIVDEVGLEDVFDRVPRENIITIYITARILTRLDRGVSESRIIRDDQRRKLSPNTYDITIDNDGSIDSLRREIHSELFRKFDEIRNRFDTKHIKVIKNESTCDNLHQSNI